MQTPTNIFDFYEAAQTLDRLIRELRTYMEGSDTQTITLPDGDIINSVRKSLKELADAADAIENLPADLDSTDQGKGASLVRYRNGLTLQQYLPTSSVAALMAASYLRIGGLQIDVQSFYAGKNTGRIPYVYVSDYPRENHNGGTILDPTHGSTPGDTGWWQAQNTGAGCFIRQGADAEPLNVLEFGARPDTSIASTSHDSQPAFDAALRTCFWSHERREAQTQISRTISIPLVNAGDRRGYYLGSRVTDKTSGWPLARPGVAWTASDLAPIYSIINFQGDAKALMYSPTEKHLFKACNDYAFRIHWIVPGFYDLNIVGQSGISSASENYPAILSNQHMYGNNVKAVFCGGPGYAGLEPGVTIASGRVSYARSRDIAVPGCIAFGLIDDNSQYGTNHDNDGGEILSNVNSCRLEGFRAQYCYGDTVFLSCSTDGGDNANGCYIGVENSSGSNVEDAIGAALCINGGWRNTGHLQVIQKNDCALKLTNYSTISSCNSNWITSGYCGDGANTQLFLDDTGGTLFFNMLVAAEFSGGKAALSTVPNLGFSTLRTCGVQNIGVVGSGLALTGFGSRITVPGGEYKIPLEGTAEKTVSLESAFADPGYAVTSGFYRVTAGLGYGSRVLNQVVAHISFKAVGSGDFRGYVVSKLREPEPPESPEEPPNTLAYDVNFNLVNDTAADVVFTTDSASSSTTGFILIERIANIASIT